MGEKPATGSGQGRSCCSSQGPAHSGASLQLASCHLLLPVPLSPLCVTPALLLCPGQGLPQPARLVMLSLGWNSGAGAGSAEPSLLWWCSEECGDTDGIFPACFQTVLLWLSTFGCQLSHIQKFKSVWRAKIKFSCYPEESYGNWSMVVGNGLFIWRNPSLY